VPPIIEALRTGDRIFGAPQRCTRQHQARVTDVSAALSEALVDPEPRVREAAADSLRGLGPQGVPVLVGALGGPGSFAASQALAVLLST
jgi:HEAT repeat protein